MMAEAKDTDKPAAGDPLGVDIVLASGSKVRAALLDAARLTFRIDPADLDEEGIRQAAEADRGHLPAEDVASLLAEVKAMTVSARCGDEVVVAADQVLICDGEVFSKPADMAAARKTLLALEGRAHTLASAVCVAKGGVNLWRRTRLAHLHMRSLSPEEIGRYLALCGDDVLASVGAYQLEGPGVHLFEAIEGDYFTILGLPLIDLLTYLRNEHGIGRP